MATDTGNGASYTFSGVTVAARRITVGERTLGNNDISVLSDSTWAKKQAHDLGEPGTVTVEHLFDPSATGTSSVPALGTTGTLTITFDQLSTTNTAASLSGSAFIVGVKPPDFANNETLVGTVTWQFDGSTGPTYTAEA